MSESKLQTPYGVFSGVLSTEYYPDGKIYGIRLDEKNVIMTHAGELIPFFGDDSPRRKYKSSVTFHEDGMLRSVSLEEQQEVMTPIGELPAELVTFYDTGELKRAFPLDGKISGFWSEEEERALNIPLRFEFDFASFTALISGICFYKSGSIKSVTLFPGEQIEITHPTLGTIVGRQGFSLYEDGTLQSLEPAVPTDIATPIGLLTAYDQSANGINADDNSLCLDQLGRITRIAISGNEIAVDGDETDDLATAMIPARVEFNYDTQTVVMMNPDGTTSSYGFTHEYRIRLNTATNSGCSDGDCASCSLCGK